MDTQEGLLSKARMGDLVAYGEIVQKYQNMAIGYAFSIIGDFHLAEDVTQEAFIEAFRCLPNLKNQDAFVTWFRRIIFKHCDRLTRKYQAESIQQKTVDEIPLDQQDPLHMIETAEKQQWVHKSIRELPELERTVTILFYLSELSHKEIAVFLEISHTQVNNLLRRARKRLKERMLKMTKAVFQNEAPSNNQKLTSKVLSALRIFAGTYEQVALSPDEKLIAFSIKPANWTTKTPCNSDSKLLSNGVPRRRGGAEIWITDMKGTHIRVLTSEWGSSWGPSWSPDGRMLAFYSDKNGSPQVWIWNRESGEIQLICNEPVQVTTGIDALIWHPNGKQIITKLRSAEWTPPSDQPESVCELREIWDTSKGETPEPAQNNSGWRWYDDYHCDLAVLNIASNKIKRLGKELLLNGIALSPDGQYIAAKCFCVNSDAGDGNVMPHNDLHLFATDGSEHKILAPDFSQASGLIGFSWSPQSDIIAYTTFVKGSGQLILAYLNGTQKVIDSDNINLGNEEGTPPLWSPTGKTIYCWANMAIYAVSPETETIQNITKDLNRRVYGIIRTSHSGIANAFGHPGSITVMTRHPQTKQEGLFRISQGEPVPIVAESNRTLLNLFLSGDCTDKYVVGPVQDATHPPDLFCIDVHTGEERRLTALNPDLEAPDYGPIKLLTFQGPDGRSLQASLFLPSNYEKGKQYPVIVRLNYGTFQSGRPMNKFEDVNARLTAAGYAVLWPDMPVSGNDPAETITALAINALDAVAKEGYIHPEHAGIMGHSEGGYDVCCAITKTNRFQAAVAVAPFTNLISFALQAKGGVLIGARWVEGGILNLRTTVWENRQRYIDNSPIFNIDKVTTPLLLLHGIEDALPISQSEEMYAGLRRLNKTATLVRYREKEHVPLEWSSENYQDYWRRTINWLDQHLNHESLINKV